MRNHACISVIIHAELIVYLQLTCRRAHVPVSVWTNEYWRYWLTFTPDTYTGQWPHKWINIRNIIARQKCRLELLSDLTLSNNFTLRLKRWMVWYRVMETCLEQNSKKRKSWFMQNYWISFLPKFKGLYRENLFNMVILSKFHFKQL